VKKVERTFSDRGVHWKITGEDKAWMDVHYTYGSPNLLVLNYGPRGGHRGVLVLPLAMLDELITVARNRPEMEIEPLSAEELFKLPLGDHPMKIERIVPR